MATYHITTLGCPKNLVDSEIVAEMLDAAGWTLTRDPLNATLLVVNTCAFVDDAQEESLQALLSAIALKREGACELVIAGGCLVQRYGHELSRKLPDLDLLVGVRDFHRLVPHIERLGSSRAKRRLYRSNQPSTRLYDRPRRPLEARHVRYLKIAEGCDCSCGFCTIPSIRGPQRSRPMSLLVAEAQTLLADGAKELIVIAQDTTSYGLDTEGRPLLPALLDNLAALVTTTEQTWLRVMYLQPSRVTKRIIAAISQPGVLPYYDLALQHSSPDVLRHMRRPTPKRGWEPLIDGIRAANHAAVIRASILLGHPGETNRAFSHLLGFLERVDLDRVGVFRFSPQQRTHSAAHRAPDAPAVEQRVHALERLLTEQATRRYYTMLGRGHRFMIDGLTEQNGHFACRPWFDAPLIDWRYTVEAKQLEPGAMITGRIVGGRPGEVVVRALDEKGTSKDSCV